jgi:hypothetical protein
MRRRMAQPEPRPKLKDAGTALRREARAFEIALAALASVNWSSVVLTETRESFG